MDLNPEAGIPETLVQEEMNRLHMNIVMLESEVYSQLTARGFFCDSVDPLTGCSMHSRSGSRYSEVYSAHKLLGAGVILGGVALAQFSPSRASPLAHQPPPEPSC